MDAAETYLYLQENELLSRTGQDRLRKGGEAAAAGISEN
jgi:hypothetical protein